ncbi:C-type lectin domain family 12 member A isoform X2 [Molossus molossus]|uniref:C-type lectin domain family 12 member A n=1 Tax=Molossus molossus TaxID=27622 RepID=A0A7J8FW23_MOLMO|nr:C-type lectin domain family 12 member A isoform X2 [Molossus molossus]KAF6451994.1 C-type lectin domain family 12 member A [Molossus molossus]
MSEEVTYADLKFQDSNKRENIQEFHQVGVKGPAPPHVWRQRVLALTLLCLLLLIGMGVLGTIFFLTSKTEMEKLQNLQNFKEELQKNVSLQLMYNIDNSKKIRNLSITLQEMTTKLCYELYRKKPEHKCKPCPKEWMWHEDSCYRQFEKSLTWQDSVMLCSRHNASLVKIKNKSVLEFIKSQKLYNYWLGFSPRNYNNIYYQILEDTIISSNWYTGNKIYLNDRSYCGYIQSIYIYYDYCAIRKFVICEKLANAVKIGSTLIE